MRLLTFVSFSPEKCNEVQLIEVNKFDRLTERWQHGIFKIDKPSNFHGCKQTFMIDNKKPMVILESDIDNLFVKSCNGVVCALLRDFSSAWNYTYDLILYPGYYKDPKIGREVQMQHDLQLLFDILSVFCGLLCAFDFKFVCFLYRMDSHD